MSERVLSLRCIFKRAAFKEKCFFKSIVGHLDFFFLTVYFIVVRTLMRSTLLNFERYNTLLLTIGTMLYSRSPELVHLA